MALERRTLKLHLLPLRENSLEDSEVVEKAAEREKVTVDADADAAVAVADEVTRRRTGSQ